MLKNSKGTYGLNHKHKLHVDELKADWELAMNGEPVYKIDPLA